MCDKFFVTDVRQIMSTSHKTTNLKILFCLIFSPIFSVENKFLIGPQTFYLLSLEHLKKIVTKVGEKNW